MQMIMYNSTLLVAYVMLIKMYYNGSLLNSHLGISSQIFTCKMVEQVVIIKHISTVYISIGLFF